MLSNTGVTPPTANEGYPRPRMPSNSAFTKVWPGSVTLSPNCWPTTVSPSTWREKAQRKFGKEPPVPRFSSLLKLILLQLNSSWLNGHNDFCHSSTQCLNVNPFGRSIIQKSEVCSSVSVHKLYSPMWASSQTEKQDIAIPRSSPLPAPPPPSQCILPTITPFLTSDWSPGF